MTASDVEKLILGFIALTFGLVRLGLWIGIAVGTVQGDAFLIGACAVPLALWFLAEIRNTLRKAYD